MKIQLEKFQEKDFRALRKLAYDGDLTWTTLNGPYFNDPVYPKEKEQEFIEKCRQTHLHNFSYKILANGQFIGSCCAYYSDGNLEKWLELGIVLYDKNTWNKGIGEKVLRQLIDKMFHETELPHLALTTWSGNIGMMKLAEKVGMKEEGRIRQVRFYNGQYWDSMKYGILRKEWEDGFKEK